MATWIISVCGIALLTVLCDVILPDGNTKKYVRTVIGIVISFSMLLPVVRFFNDVPSGAFDFESEISTQEQFLDGIDEQKQLARLQKVKGVISTLDVKDNSVTLESNGYVRVSVRCDQETLLAVQSALAGIDDKIMIVWSKSSG